MPDRVIHIHDLDDGRIAMLKDKDGFFYIRWRHPILGSIIERMEIGIARGIQEAMQKFEPK